MNNISNSINTLVTTGNPVSPLPDLALAGALSTLSIGLLARYPLLGLALAGALSGVAPAAFAQDRWFQIEVSVFSNENASDRNAEYWLPDPDGLHFPRSMKRLQNLLDILLIETPLPEHADKPLADSAVDNNPLAPKPDSALAQAQQQADAIAKIGPPPATEGEGFRFPDFDRDGFLQMPSELSDFQQTNRALDRSPEHRLLWHGLWRQPVLDPGNATPIYVSGGQQYGDYQELMGSIEIRFNERRNRVVIDADLWLSEFSSVEPGQRLWELPLPPAEFHNDSSLSSPLAPSASSTPNNRGTRFAYYPIQVYRLQQTRAMRSTEFHYLDHPALGIVVTVHPYQRPAAAPPGFSGLASSLEDFSAEANDTPN